LKITDIGADDAQNFVNKRHQLAHLALYKMAFALHGDLDKSVARHVLHAVVGLVHEFEQFVHHRLEEFPVGSQKSVVVVQMFVVCTFLLRRGRCYRLFVFSFIRFSINVLTRSNAADSLSPDEVFSSPRPTISVSV
jgi:hypothetical protein